MNFEQELILLVGFFGRKFLKRHLNGDLEKSRCPILAFLQWCL